MAIDGDKLAKSGAPQSISDLKADPNNPRTITPEAQAGLTHSLESFGDISGIVWNRRSGTLVAGHQRVEALRAKHGAALHLDGGELVAPTGERYRIRVVDWPEAKARAALVAANHAGIQGEWTGQLPALLADIELTLPTDFEALHLADLDPPADISTNPTPDPAADLAEAIQDAQEHLDSENVISRVVARVERALHQRDPQDINRAILIILPGGKAGELAVLIDPCWGDACQELRRHYEAGADSPIEELFARLLSFEEAGE